MRQSVREKRAKFRRIDATADKRRNASLRGFVGEAFLPIVSSNELKATIQIEQSRRAMARGYVSPNFGKGRV